MLRSRCGDGLVSARPKGTSIGASTLWHEFAVSSRCRLRIIGFPVRLRKASRSWRSIAPNRVSGDDLNLESSRRSREKEALAVGELIVAFFGPSLTVSSRFRTSKPARRVTSSRRSSDSRQSEDAGTIQGKSKPLGYTKAGARPNTCSLMSSSMPYTRRSVRRITAAVDFSCSKAGAECRTEKLSCFSAERPDNFFANLKLASYYRKEGEHAKAVGNSTRPRASFPVTSSLTIHISN